MEGEFVERAEERMCTNLRKTRARIANEGESKKANRFVEGKRKIKKAKVRIRRSADFINRR
jgi:hypothetical protein